MKTIISACAIAAALVSMPASAQWYVGAGVGSSKITGVDGSQGIAPNSVTGANSNKGSAKVFLGYQATPNWGVEGQYTDLGSRDFQIRNGANAVIGTGAYRSSQFSIAGTGTLPMSSGFSLFGKLGVTSNSGNVNVVAPGVNASASGSQSSLMVGIGAAYNITPALAVRLEYEDFGKMISGSGFGGTVRGNNVSLGLKYAF
ncbi:MAG: outer membrane beta-barrel protein [Pseudomonadota bacterium]